MDMELIGGDELSEISREIMSCFQILHGTADEATLRQLAAVVEKVHSQAVSMANRLEDNQDRISYLQRQIEEYEKGNSDLRTDLRLAKEQHEQAISKIDADFSKELNTYKKELVKMKTENRSVKAMNDRLMAEVQELEVTGLRHEMLNKESAGELEKTKKELEEAHDALDEVRPLQQKTKKVVVDSSSQTSVDLTPPNILIYTDEDKKTTQENKDKGSGHTVLLDEINETQNSSSSEESEDYERQRRSKCPSFEEIDFQRQEHILNASLSDLETEDESGIEEEERSLEEELNAVEKSEAHFDENSEKPEQGSRLTKPEEVEEEQCHVVAQPHQANEKELDEQSEDEVLVHTRAAIVNSMHKLVAITDRVMDHIDDIDGPTELEKLFSGCVVKRSENKPGGFPKADGKNSSKKKNIFLQCCGMVLFVAGLYLLCNFLCDRYLGFGIFRLKRRGPGYTTALF